MHILWWMQTPWQRLVFSAWNNQRCHFLPAEHRAVSATARRLPAEHIDSLCCCKSFTTKACSVHSSTLGHMSANDDYHCCLPCGGAQVANGNRLLPSQREPITASLSSTTNIENIIWALACLNYFQVAKCFEAWDAIPLHHLCYWARRNVYRPFEIQAVLSVQTHIVDKRFLLLT